MYKKSNVACLMMSMIFNGYAMEQEANLGYELVPLSETQSSLAAALQKLDESYKTEQKADIQTNKREYYDLVAKETTDVSSIIEEQTGQWQDVTNLYLQDKNIKTVLLVLPHYINPMHLKSANFSNNALQDLSLSFLAKRMPNLETLVLSNNNISYVSTCGKNRLPKLSHLTLKQNKITAIDFIALLKKCPNLEMLDLSDNPLEVIISDDKCAWNTCLNKKFAIDVRNTKLSQNDIALLTQYCLAGVHNSFKVELFCPFLGGSFVGSWFGFGFVSLCAQQGSLATFAGGATLGTALAAISVCCAYKKDASEYKEFHAIRYDDEEKSEEI